MNGVKSPSNAPSHAKPTGLRRVAASALTIKRIRSGRGFRYVASDGAPILDPDVLQRLKSLAVPPAYTAVYFARDPLAHLQAVGRDAAGRLQYRYHPKWEQEREARKARHLARLVEALPRIRRRVDECLDAQTAGRAYALAAVIKLVDATAIRAGGENSMRETEARGATTLQKSDATTPQRSIRLAFTGKGGKQVFKEIRSPALLTAIKRLRCLPGRRLFQYRDPDGNIRRVRAAEVNAFLRDLSGRRISLKDFRTMCACTQVLEALAQTQPGASQHHRRRQVREAVRDVAIELANTPAICRKSYVHEIVVDAFENGSLTNAAARPTKHLSAGEKMLAKIIAT